jgi:formylglycine-generating enzyme required for sulfatase activity
MGKKKTGRRVVLGGVFLLLVVVVAVLASFSGTLLLWRRLSDRFDLHTLRNDQGHPEFVHRESGILFVALPAGVFRRGSPEDEPDRESREGPVHEVSLTAFLIAKYELRQSEWKRVMGENPSFFKGDDLPVEWVTHDECWQFTARTGFTLPTEAQWEYACRAGTATPFAFGSKIDTQRANFDGNYPYDGAGRERYRGRTLPVDSFPPNAFGLHNMHGNVAEWCLDYFDEDFYESAGANESDPVCDSVRPKIVVRGGTWSRGARYCRSAARGWRPKDYRNVSVGFRPVFLLEAE